MSRGITVFDICQLINVKLYINSEFYPYVDLNLDFSKNRYTVLFDMHIFIKLITNPTATKCYSM